MPQARRDDDRPTSRGALLLALAASIVVGVFVPFGRLLLYPFTLMATWVHEMGHGLAALAVGGGFDRLEIFANASGLAHTLSWTSTQRGIVAVSGLLAPPLAGAAIFALARGPRRARAVLAAMALAMVVSLVVWVRSVAGWVALPLVAALLAAFAAWASPRERMFLAQFAGLRLGADTVSRIDYVFSDRVTIDGLPLPSDIATVASSFGGPRVLWSAAVAAGSFTLVVTGLLVAWWSGRAAPAGPVAHLARSRRR